jgi:hypothetical protein
MATRLSDGGRVVPHHVRNAGTLRGTLTIKQEDDHIRHRMTLVARFSPQWITIRPAAVRRRTDSVNRRGVDACWI